MFRSYQTKASTALLVFLSAFVLMVRPSFAQDNKNDLVDSSIRDITTVMVAGAGGAVLGLSTLSFVDEPKDHLRNILVGGAIGIIVGVGYVAYKQANMSKDDFKTGSLNSNDPHFSTAARQEWHKEEFHARSERSVEENPTLTYSFHF